MQTFVNQQNEAITDEEDFSADEDEMLDSGLVMDSVYRKKCWVLVIRVWVVTLPG